MKEIAAKTGELILAMQNSREYQRYRALEEELNNNRELRSQIDAYRNKAYNLAISGNDAFDETDQVLAEFDSLLDDPLAVEYLAVESAVCSMIRRVVNDINEAVPVRIPVFE